MIGMPEMLMIGGIAVLIFVGEGIRGFRDAVTNREPVGKKDSTSTEVTIDTADH